MYSMLRPEDDLEPTSVVSTAEAAGLVLVDRTLAGSRDVGESPLASAQRIESRTFSSLWDLDEDTWVTVVEPAIAQLRALPDADQPRTRSVTQELFVFTAKR